MLLSHTPFPENMYVVRGPEIQEKMGHLTEKKKRMRIPRDKKQIKKLGRVN